MTSRGTLSRALGLVLLGLAAAAAMPPINAAPLFVVSIAGLLYAQRESGWRGCFAAGWLWGIGFFVPTLYWISLSLMVDIGQFWWLLPFIFLGLPAMMSLYPAAACAASRLAAPRRGIVSVIAFAGWWSLGEWLRGHLFSGFPWLMAGYVWSGNAPPLLAGLQASAEIGMYALSFTTVLIAGLFVLALDPGSLAWRARGPGLATLMLVALIGFGFARLSGADDATVPNLIVRIVSTNLPHRAEWSPEDARADFATVLRVARSPGFERAAVQVWPEGVVETALNRNPGTRAAIASALPKGGVALVGTTHVEGDGPEAQAWNSVMAIDAAGDVRGIYDKHHLVPLGEYVPLRWVVGVNQIAAARYDFSEGPGPRTLELPDLPSVGPIICYESIFPGAVIDPADRPRWMINVTDDGWFGQSLGPAQHFAIARARAVEEGLPLVRAANGGISAVIDGWGRVRAALPLATEGVLDAPLPLPVPYPVNSAHDHAIGYWLVVLLSISTGIWSKMLPTSRRN